MTLGQRIRTLRKAARKTQKEMADLLGMGSSNFGHIENDRVVPGSGDLRRIAEILGSSTDYLLGLADRTDVPNGRASADTAEGSPGWASARDIRDFKRMLEEDEPVMFDGVPISREDREKIKRVMEAMFWDAKKKNKRTYAEE